MIRAAHVYDLWKLFGWFVFVRGILDYVRTYRWVVKASARYVPELHYLEPPKFIDNYI